MTNGFSWKKPWTGEITKHPEVAKLFLCGDCEGMSFESDDGPWCDLCRGLPIVPASCFLCGEDVEASESFLVDIEAEVVCLACEKAAGSVVSTPDCFVGRKPAGDDKWVTDTIGRFCDWHEDRDAIRLANREGDRDVIESDATEHKLQ